MPIRIWGQSDDLLEIGGDVVDEIGCYDKPAGVEIRANEHERAPGVRIIGHYAPDKSSGAVWRMAVEPIDEDIPIPWPVSIGMKDGYSPIVTVDCPPGVTVRFGAEADDE